MVVGGPAALIPYVPVGRFRAHPAFGFQRGFWRRAAAPVKDNGDVGENKVDREEPEEAAASRAYLAKRTSSLGITICGKTVASSG